MISKMPQCCAVPMCSNKTGGHKFPTADKNRLQQWLLAIRRDKYTPTKNSLVCKSHFTACDYELPKDSVLRNPRPVLKKSAVPSKFPWNEQSLSMHQKKKQRQIRLKRNGKIFLKVLKNNEKEIDENSHMENMNGCEVNIEVDEKQRHVGIQCNLATANDLKTLQEYHKNKNRRKKTLIENILDITNAAEVHFYTGFHDYEHIQYIFNILGDEVNSLKRTETLKMTSINPCDQFLIVLIKLHRNMLFQELAFRLKVTKIVLSNIFITWINFLYCKLKELRVWLPKECMNKIIKYYSKFNPFTAILHHAEINIKKPAKEV